MTQLEKMYEGKINSPETFLRDGLVSGGTVIYLMDDSILPTLPNLLVIGKDQTAETVLVTEKRSDGGYNIQRAIQGTAKDWSQGTSCSRNFTEYDYDKLIKNIEKLNSAKQDNLTAGSNITITNNKISATDTVYTHPSTHQASMITETTDRKWMSSSERTKLDGIEANANNYTHPSTHPASIITQTTGKRFVSDTEKTTWNNKQDKLTTGSNITIDSNNKISVTVPVQSVNSKTGAVTITKSDVGLGSVENIGIVILSEAEYEALSDTEKARTDKLYGTY